MHLEAVKGGEGAGVVVVEVPRRPGHRPRPPRREQQEVRAPVRRRPPSARSDHVVDRRLRALTTDCLELVATLERLEVRRRLVDPRRGVVAHDAAALQHAPHDVAHGRGLVRGERSAHAQVAALLEVRAVSVGQHSGEATAVPSRDRPRSSFVLPCPPVGARPEGRRRRRAGRRGVGVARPRVAGAGRRSRRGDRGEPGHREHRGRGEGDGRPCERSRGRPLHRARDGQPWRRHLARADRPARVVRHHRGILRLSDRRADGRADARGVEARLPDSLQRRLRRRPTMSSS